MFITRDLWISNLRIDKNCLELMVGCTWVDQKAPLVAFIAV